jgi:hypothetical protein
MKNVKISYACTAGKNHAMRGEPCQDYVCGYAEDGFGAVMLSDGAGSKKYALESACLAAESAMEFVRKNIGRADGKTFRTELERQINKAMADSGLDADKMGATLLFAVFAQDKTLIGHIGDGVIIGARGDGFEVVSKPENGYCANQTYFFPTDESDGSSRFRFCIEDSGKYSDFLLASDGISHILYDFDTGEVAEVCRKFVRWNREYSREECSAALERNLMGIFSKYGSDDKSVALISVIA